MATKTARTTTTKTATTKAKPKAPVGPLRSAALPQKDLIDVGARYSASSLTNHATTVLSKVAAQNDASEAESHFSEYGFGPAWIAAVEALMARIAGAGDAQTALSSDALPTAAALEAAFANAKKIRRIGVTVIAADPTRTQAMGALGTGASVPATRKALGDLAKKVPLDAPTPLGTGKELRAKAQAALKTLDATVKAHRAALAKLSPAAGQLHAMKGILQQELKSVARVARTVSPADAALYAIEKHTHVYEPSKKHPAKTEAATTTSGTNAAGAEPATAPPPAKA